MSLVVHHLNCGSLCPVVGRLFHNHAHQSLVCHCLLVETAEGLVLVDTGLGMRDVLRSQFMETVFHTLVRPKLLPHECAIRQIEALGFHASDVRHIIITHLDCDHAGGLADFPNAQVHVYHSEWDAAQEQPLWAAMNRYQAKQWHHSPHWVLHKAEGEQWHGFNSVAPLHLNSPELLMIPLPGHSRGHCGVAIKTATGWLLHAGDAYFCHSELIGGGRKSPLGLRIAQHINADNTALQKSNLRRLSELKKTDKAIEIICSHDAYEFCRATHPQRL